jgi:hypothetical protein
MVTSFATCHFWLLLQAAQMPPQLASARISYKDFKAMASLRSSIYALAFALDFCSQVSCCTQHKDLWGMLQQQVRHLQCCSCLALQRLKQVVLSH